MVLGNRGSNLAEHQSAGPPLRPRVKSANCWRDRGEILHRNELFHCSGKADANQLDCVPSQSRCSPIRERRIFIGAIL